MASKYWIKLYHEILDDPKMGLMADRLWRRTIELFLVAGEFDDNGMLPSVRDMAYRLRLTDDELIADFTDLIEEKIISQRDDGTYYVTKFRERQAAMSSTKRSRLFRETQRKIEYYGNPNDNETMSQQDGDETGTNRCANVDESLVDKIRLDKNRLDEKDGLNRYANEGNLETTDEIIEKEDHLINAFCEIAKIPYPFQMKIQMEWIQQVGEWIDLGVTRENIEKAVDIADTKGLSIARPASITNIIRSEMSYRKRNGGKDRDHTGEVYYGPDGEEIMVRV